MQWCVTSVVTSLLRMDGWMDEWMNWLHISDCFNIRGTPSFLFAPAEAAAPQAKKEKNWTAHPSFLTLCPSDRVCAGLQLPAAVSARRLINVCFTHINDPQLHWWDVVLTRPNYRQTDLPRPLTKEREELSEWLEGKQLRGGFIMNSISGHTPGVLLFLLCLDHPPPLFFLIQAFPLIVKHYGGNHGPFPVCSSVSKEALCRVSVSSQTSSTGLPHVETLSSPPRTKKLGSHRQEEAGREK